MTANRLVSIGNCSNRAWMPWLVFALSFWASMAVTMKLSRNLDDGICTIVLAIYVVFALTSCVLTIRCSSVVCLAMLAVFLGGALSATTAMNLHSLMGNVDSSGVQAYSGIVVQDSREGEYGSSLIARIKLENGRKAKVRVNLRSDQSVFCGQILRFQADLKVPNEDRGEYYWSKGIAGIASPQHIEVSDGRGILGAVSSIRIKGINLLKADLNSRRNCEEGIYLLEALLFGYKSDLANSQISEKFTNAGLSHLVAISGTHLVIVVGMLSLLLGFLRLPKGVSIAIQIMASGMYAFFAGLPVSAIRASIMLAISFSAFFAKRKATSVASLCVCVVVMLLLNPADSQSLSLVLSASACLGMMLTSTFIDPSKIHSINYLPVSARQSLLATLSATVFTLPFVAYAFGRVSIISPISNMFIAPIVPVLISGGYICMALDAVLPFKSFALMSVVEEGARMTCSFVDALGSLRCASVSVSPIFVVIILAMGAIATMLYRYRDRFGKTGVCAGVSGILLLILLAFAPWPFLGCRIVMMDVGQGDAFLIQSKGRSVLVDTGTDDKKVVQSLRRYGASRLDAIVISHADDDHCGSIKAIEENTTVKNVCVANDLMQNNTKNSLRLLSDIGSVNVKDMRVGDSISFNGISLKALSPESFSDDGGNQDSLVLMCEIDVDSDGVPDWKALFTGDAESETLEKLSSDGLLEDVDILKVPHHGSKKSLSSKVLDVVQPEMALISVGAKNRYGHPTEASLSLLESYGSKVYRTDESGDVVCNFTSDRISVATLK